MDLGKAMQTIREERGFSRREMAEKLGIRPTSLWKIEKGVTQPRMATIVTFCRRTETPLAYLFDIAKSESDYTPPT